MTDWTRPEESGWHWLRAKHTGGSFLARWAGGLWDVFSMGGLHIGAYTPDRAGRQLDYIAPALPPEETKP